MKGLFIKIINNRRGFSLAELIVVIAIMIILVALLTPNVIGYVDKAKESTFKNDARIAFEAAQLSLINVKAHYPADLNSMISEQRYTFEGVPVGRISNFAISANQLNSGHISNSMMPAENRLAVSFLEAMGWGDANSARYPFKSNATPFGQDVVQYQKATNQPGVIIVFDGNGTIRYMEWGEGNYLARITKNGNNTEVIKNGSFVEESVFN